MKCEFGDDLDVGVFFVNREDLRGGVFISLPGSNPRGSDTFRWLCVIREQSVDVNCLTSTTLPRSRHAVLVLERSVVSAPPAPFSSPRAVALVSVPPVLPTRAVARVHTLVQNVKTAPAVPLPSRYAEPNTLHKCVTKYETSPKRINVVEKQTALVAPAAAAIDT